MCFKNDFVKNPAFDQKIDVFLSDEYKDYCNVFNWKKINELPFHHQYDHWIKLIDERIPSWSKIYSLSGYKLQKMKEYIAENFKKNFIEFSKIPYFMSILFALKINEDLQFCIDYWELNVIIKCNCYLISLIDEMLA